MEIILSIFPTSHVLHADDSGAGSEANHGFGGLTSWMHPHA
jgi:hypothetical protein